MISPSDEDLNRKEQAMARKTSGNPKPKRSKPKKSKTRKTFKAY